MLNRLIRTSSLIFLSLLFISPSQAEWVDISPSVTITQSPFSFDRINRLRFNIVSIENNMEIPLQNPLRVRIKATSVQAINANGVLDNGDLYYTIPDKIPPNSIKKIKVQFPLVRGEISYSTTLEIDQTHKIFSVYENKTLIADFTPITPYGSDLEKNGFVDWRLFDSVALPSYTSIDFRQYECSKNSPTEIFWSTLNREYPSLYSANNNLLTLYQVDDQGHHIETFKNFIDSWGPDIEFELKNYQLRRDAYFHIFMDLAQFRRFPGLWRGYQPDNEIEIKNIILSLGVGSVEDTTDQLLIKFFEKIDNNEKFIPQNSLAFSLADTFAGLGGTYTEILTKGGKIASGAANLAQLITAPLNILNDANIYNSEQKKQALFSFFIDSAYNNHHKRVLDKIFLSSSASHDPAMIDAWKDANNAFYNRTVNSAVLIGMLDNIYIDIAANSGQFVSASAGLASSYLNSIGYIASSKALSGLGAAGVYIFAVNELYQGVDALNELQNRQIQTALTINVWQTLSDDNNGLINKKEKSVVTRDIKDFSDAVALQRIMDFLIIRDSSIQIDTIENGTGGALASSFGRYIANLLSSDKTVIKRLETFQNDAIKDITLTLNIPSVFNQIDSLIASGIEKIESCTVNYSGDYITHYSFSNDMLTKVIDDSGNNYTGTPYGNLIHLEGINDQSVAFDGFTKSYIQTKPNPLSDIGTEDFTVSTWVNIDTIKTNYLFFFGENLYGGEKSIRGFVDEKSKVIFYISDNAVDTNNASQVTSLSSLSPGTWHHLVFSRKDSIMSLYVNGKLEGSAESKQNLNSTGFNKSLTIGIRPTNWNYPLSGKIDEITIYNRGLFDDEINNMYKEHSLTAHYLLDGNANDSGINNTYDGIEQGGVDVTGSAGLFDGVNDSIALPDSLDTLKSNNAKSVFAWVKIPADVSSAECSGWGYLRSVVDNSPAGHWRYLGIHIRDGVYKAASGMQAHQTYVEGDTLSPDTWHLIGFTWSPDSSLKVYTDNNAPVSSPNTIPSWDTVSGSTFIGRQYSNPCGHYFKGAIKDVRFYDRQLNNSEVDALYNSGNTTP